MKAKVVRLAKYPKENPVGYAVGFEITVAGTTFYKDTVINFEDIVDGTEQGLVGAAWEIIKPDIELRREELEAASPIIGTTWYDENPEPEVIEEDQPIEETPPVEDQPVAGE